MYFSQGLCGKSWKQEHKRENRCEIGGKVFEKQKERQARGATHRACRIKQAPCRLLFVLWEVTVLWEVEENLNYWGVWLRLKLRNNILASTTRA